MSSQCTEGFESLVCGGFAGTAAKLVVYPLDMLKKRLQVRVSVCDTRAHKCR